MQANQGFDHVLAHTQTLGREGPSFIMDVAGPGLKSPTLNEPEETEELENDYDAYTPMYSLEDYLEIFSSPTPTLSSTSDLQLQSPTFDALLAIRCSAESTVATVACPSSSSPCPQPALVLPPSRSPHAPEIRQTSGPLCTEGSSEGMDTQGHSKSAASKPSTSNHRASTDSPAAVDRELAISRDRKRRRGAEVDTEVENTSRATTSSEVDLDAAGPSGSRAFKRSKVDNTGFASSPTVPVEPAAPLAGLSHPIPNNELEAAHPAVAAAVAQDDQPAAPLRICGMDGGCPHVLVDSQSLNKTHLNEHEGEDDGKFRCTYLGCTNNTLFSHKHNRNRHVIKEHWREWFACDVPGCNKRYGRKDGVNRHKNAVHRA
ncbi:hypothetical protein BN946_scf185016.g71 [Trametes cinnabarina]|uniref:C2H2-type domain-containing protein n=1 Tax=Pycnoporus cinnabarinus TaxID=5643 RepID=A0A060SNX0_PYCCI|nr:hypothetical protein BN946_scf185016.g71 [Trametes cinnabarina]